MTNMDKIEALIQQGITEREQMRTLSGLEDSQIRSALGNLVTHGRIRVAKRRPMGRGKGSAQAIYEIGKKAPPPIPEAKKYKIINSVFQLGGL